MKTRGTLVAMAVTISASWGTDSSAQDLAKGLVGAWKLVSTEQRLSDGTRRPSPLYGPEGVGYLFYSDSGRRRAVLTDLEGNRLTLRPAEKLANGVLEYTLTWERVQASPAGAVKP